MLFPPPRDLPDPRIEPTSLTSSALAVGFFIASTTWEAQVKVLVSQSCLTLCDPIDCDPRLLCPRNSPGKNTGADSHSLSPGDLPNPGIKSKSPSLQADSLPPEPPWKRLQITHSTRQWGAQYFLLWKLTELKKQDGRLQSYESLGLNFHSALTACGFGQVPSPAGLTGL